MQGKVELCGVNTSKLPLLKNAELRELLNSVELHPQKTNYPVVDALLENLTAQFTGDNYDRLKAAYDWATMNITYSWWPYTQDFAPAYDCFWPQMDMPCAARSTSSARLAGMTTMVRSS